MPPISSLIRAFSAALFISLAGSRQGWTTPNERAPHHVTARADWLPAETVRQIDMVQGSGLLSLDKLFCLFTVLQKNRKGLQGVR